MRFHSFGSGSSGNAFLLDTGETRILFDCGVGIRRLRKALADLQVVSKIDAVVISHEHSDHIRSLDALVRYEGCPVFASSGTFQATGKKAGWIEVRAHRSTIIGGVEVTPVPVSHDANEPFGYLIDAGSERVALFTDLGEPSSIVNDAVRESSIVIMESNYCETMLRKSSYPSFLKRRIRSQLGHLSNDDCAATLAEGMTPAVHTVWLAHLSENNNSPETAEHAVMGALSSQGIGMPIRSLPRHDVADLLDKTAVERSWQSSLI